MMSERTANCAALRIMPRTAPCAPCAPASGCAWPCGRTCASAQTRKRITTMHPSVLSHHRASGALHAAHHALTQRAASSARHKRGDRRTQKNAASSRHAHLAGHRRLRERSRRERNAEHEADGEQAGHGGREAGGRMVFVAASNEERDRLLLVLTLLRLAALHPRAYGCQLSTSVTPDTQTNDSCQREYTHPSQR